MYFDEVNKIENCKNEDEMIKVVEEIGDKIAFRDYEEHQVVSLVNSLLRVDFLSMKYETREEILSVLCDAVSNYKISSKIDWSSISKIKNIFENDLKEYVDEFLHN